MKTRTDGGTNGTNGGTNGTNGGTNGGNDDTAAQRLLLEQHWPLAGATARRVYRDATEAEREDAEALALLALWRACQSFDGVRGTFGGYATMVMERALFDARRSERQGKRGGRAAQVRTLRLDAPIAPAAGGGEDGGTLADVLADPVAEAAVYRIEGEEMAAETVVRIERLVSAGALSHKAADALYGAARGETQAATGRRLGVSGQRVAVLQRQAREALRSVLLQSH